MPTSILDPIDELLRGIGRSLDIPAEMQLEAVRRYTHLGQWLATKYDIGWTVEIYPQGSMRLGTVVRPDFDVEQYDLDMVLVIHVDKDQITKQQLRDATGEMLKAYIEDNEQSIICIPKLHERGRCWTLDFSAIGFHMDVLPAVPRSQGDETAIAITDRDLFHWQYSNPIAYADWFLTKTPDPLFEEARRRVASRMQVSIEEVPRFVVRTPLQRAVQVVKRHRDLYFADEPDLKPASILVTTLVAHGYSGTSDLRTILTGFLDGLAANVTNDGGTWWVPNPVEAEENLADKWNTAPERRIAFERWTAQLQSDLGDVAAEVGLDRIAARLGAGFGVKVVTAAAAGLGATLAAGARSVSATGSINAAAASTRPIGPHTFHGSIAPTT